MNGVSIQPIRQSAAEAAGRAATGPDRYLLHVEVGHAEQHAGDLHTTLQEVVPEI
jgi:hypothetical protein